MGQCRFSEFFIPLRFIGVANGGELFRLFPGQFTLQLYDLLLGIVDGFGPTLIIEVYLCDLFGRPLLHRIYFGLQGIVTQLLKGLFKVIQSLFLFRSCFLGVLFSFAAGFFSCFILFLPCL